MTTEESNRNPNLARMISRVICSMYGQSFSEIRGGHIGTFPHKWYFQFSSRNKQPRSFTLDRILSVPLNSDDFLTTGFRSGFRRTRSDQFPSVPPISDEFLIGILRNLPEIFRWKPDRNLLVRKSSEFNGTDRKITEPMRFDAGNDRIHWSY